MAQSMNGYHKMWPYEVNLVLLNLSVWGVQKILVRSVNGCDSKLRALAVCSESEKKASTGNSCHNFYDARGILHDTIISVYTIHF